MADEQQPAAERVQSIQVPPEVTNAAGVCLGCARWHRRRRRRRVLLLVVLLLIPVAIVAGFPVYVHPRTDTLRKADAIFILGGPGDRRAYGFSLYDQGWAPNVVVSNPIGPYEPSYPTMWTNSWCRSSTWGSEFLSNGRQWPTSARYCPSPQPATTLGEARALRDLAAQHGWHTVIAVTFRPHISRARLILQRCFHGDLIMAASPADIAPAQWVYEYVYQTTGFVKALFADQC
ncbi:MAG: YdcF family protein [Mycobacterium sp.]|nr:YdcF family protein [Mycobacterium sp.]